MSASIQGMCERLTKEMGRPELIDDPRFRTNEDRVHHRDELDGIIQDFMAQRSLDDNLRFFEDVGSRWGRCWQWTICLPIPISRDGRW